jgi:hypothetical protein
MARKTISVVEARTPEELRQEVVADLQERMKDKRLVSTLGPILEYWRGVRIVEPGADPLAAPRPAAIKPAA